MSDQAPTGTFTGTAPDDGSEGGGRRANKGVWIRAFIYVIGFHVFAGFVMALFLFGGRNH